MRIIFLGFWDTIHETLIKSFHIILGPGIRLYNKGVQ